MSSSVAQLGPHNALRAPLLRIQAQLRSMGLLQALAVSHACVLILWFVAGRIESPVLNLAMVSFAGVVGLCGIDKFFLKAELGRSVLLILIGAYLAKVAVGIVHFVWLLHPNYLQFPDQFVYAYDFVWMHDSMIQVSQHWSRFGLFSPLPADYLEQNKNAFLNAYNAIVYYLGGVNVLSIAPWNALHSLYSAAIVGALALKSGATKQQARLALVIAAFQPFGFISSIFWRDTVGQTAIALAAYLLIMAEDSEILSMIVLPVAVALAASQRQAYGAVVLAVAIFLNFRKARNSSLRMIFVIVMVLGLAYAAITMDVTSTLSDYSTHLGAQMQRNVEIAQLPMRVIRALVGPFPWYQMFYVNFAEYMPADFTQQVLNVAAYLFVIAVAVRRLKHREPVDVCMLFGIGLFALAVIAPGIHSSYVSIGTILFLPLASRVDSRTWVRALVVIFILFIFANVLYWSLGLTDSGFSGIMEG